MKNIFKTVSNFLIDHIQGITFTFLILISAGYYAYTLGYSTNWATIASPTRAAEFYNASQQANRLMHDLGFIGVLLMLFGLFSQSHKRKHYYISNIVLSIFSAIMLLVQAALTLYYNSVLVVMYQNANIPDTAYQSRNMVKSYVVFEAGNMLAILMIVFALWLIGFVFYKLRLQKERKALIQKAVASYEH